MLFLVALIILAAVYLLFKSKVFQTSVLDAIPLFEGFFFVTFWTIGFFLARRDLKRKHLIFELTGIALVLFMLEGIFTQELTDLFFWDGGRKLHQGFFSFSFAIYSWLYVLAFPFLIFLAYDSLVAFFLIKKKGPN